MGVARTLGSYVHRASYDELPQNVVNVAKDRILDFLGTAFDSYSRYPMTKVINVLKAYGAKEEATVIGDGSKLPCTFAALVNSAYNISDGSRFAGGHPACVEIPGTLAVAETRCKAKAVSGKELILAVVLGYEVMLRIGEPMYPSVHKRGFQPTTVRGPMGVAASASKLLGLDEESTIHAISIAGLMGGGLQAADRAPYPLFSFQIGRAAEAGILSALVAQAGLKGSDEILEAGFFSAFSDEDEYHLDSIGKDLGKDFAIAKTYIKMHYGCRHMHPPIDAALYLRNTHGIRWEDIERIKIRTYSTALAVCDIENPQTGRQAEYTINFGVIAALVYGDASTDRFTDEVLKSEPVQTLMRRITIVHDPELDKEHPRKWSTIVEITLKNGKAYSHKLDFARGEPENPFSKTEIETKFNEMASKALNKERRQRIVDFVNHLESKESVEVFFPLLKATSDPARSV